MARVPAPCSPDARPMPYGIIDIRRFRYSIVRPPVGSLPVLANTIYNPVTIEQEIIRLNRMIYKQRVSSTPVGQSSQFQQVNLEL